MSQREADMSEIEPISAKTMELAGQIVEIARSENIGRGDRLYEHRLANRLGVSRGPVRAALRSLAQSGLAEAIPNKGFVLAQDLDSEIALRALRAGDTSEAAYLAIANDRLTGALPDTVSEAELMRRYDLKRAELLRLLDRIASEGWVERLRGYGWKFTQTLNSPLAYAQTGRLRMMIEPGGILEPTFQWNAELMGPVREHQKRVQADGMRVFTLSEMFRFGCEVHEAIAECSGNAFLVETLRRINRVRRLFAYKFIPDLQMVEQHTREHLQLLDLLEKGDRTEAAALMRTHLHWSGGGDQIA
ncbi:DNA-binding GntR family transcriptional regulator [Bosea psychrotolerans]|uniref:DNA-binding GntR family transcriptional regulator n=2 Tax=Bosea psychrotolerans TaxID=1871628 RepID=A0A2S4MCG0_9HYPH|nr:DNA-binding GntR family transcriptional regulator [Bosea psychrotolerans]